MVDGFSLKKAIAVAKASPIVRGGGILLLIKVFGLGAAFVLQIGLARHLGSDEFGIYTFAISCGILLAILASIGLPTAAVRFVAQARASEDWREIAGVMLWARTLSASLGFLVLLVGGTLVVYGLGTTKFGANALLAGLIGVPLVALFRTNMALVRGFEMPVLAFAPEMLGRPVVMIVLGLVFYFLTGAISAFAAICISQITLAVVLVTQFVIFRQRLPVTVKSASRTYNQRRWLSVCLPLALVSGFEVVNERIDVLMVGAYLTPHDVGLYHAASRVAGLLLIVLSTGNAIVAPIIARLHSSGNMEELQRTVQLILSLVFLPTAILALVLIFNADFVLGIFGQKFVEADVALKILCLAQLVNTGAGPVLMLMNMTGLQNKSAYIFAVTALCNVLLNALLIPRLGINGAAIATSCSILLWNIWMAIVVRRSLGISSYIFGGTTGR